MTIIDFQVHAYEANTSKRPWHSVPNWPDHVRESLSLIPQRLMGPSAELAAQHTRPA